MLSNHRKTVIVKPKELRFPVRKSLPVLYTEEQVATVTGAGYVVYDVTESGFYKVTVRGGGPNVPYKGTGGGGGYTTQIVYLYRGTKCLLWGGGGGGATGCGYPGTQDGSLGGRGGWSTSGESGGAGGGAATSATADYAYGGAGSGFLAGIDRRVSYSTHTEPEWSVTLDTHRSWEAGENFQVSNLYCYILAGGGGASRSDEGSNRASGGAGGAFGNGGGTYGGTGPQSGPGGTWGKGQDGGHYGNGTLGAWCIIDFSRDQFDWGLGVEYHGSGFCTMWKIVPRYQGEDLGTLDTNIEDTVDCGSIGDTLEQINMGEMDG